MTMTIFVEVKFASVKVAVSILFREFAMFMGFSIKVEIWKVVGKSLGESLREWKEGLRER